MCIDAIYVPNITDDSVFCHFVMNGITIAQARRWRIWAVRAHERVDYPHLPTPTLAEPLLPWIAEGNAAPPGQPEVATQVQPEVAPDVDVPMGDLPQVTPTGAGGSGGPPPPSQPGSGGLGGDLEGQGGNPSEMEPPPSTQPRIP